ncbi:MAG: hypothetical protein M3290_13345, partial [Actinomycetota bacterium]|nr:hypothetical protein [Actinomycetota bacterium]
MLVARTAPTNSRIKNLGERLDCALLRRPQWAPYRSGDHMISDDASALFRDEYLSVLRQVIEDSEV